MNINDLPWLVVATGPGPARRRAERTERAALDLAAVAERIDGYLVLHEAVDISFAFEARHMPLGTVDLRQEGDAVGLALSDPDAAVVTGAGMYIGTPIAKDPRWGQVAELGRSRALLVTSALSGAYFGCYIHGPHEGRFRDGIAEQFVGLAARLEYEDGSALNIERTTLGYVSSGFGRPRNSQSLASIIESVPDTPTRVISDLLGEDELVAVLAEAHRLPPASLTLNGRRWRGQDR